MALIEDYKMISSNIREAITLNEDTYQRWLSFSSRGIQTILLSKKASEEALKDLGTEEAILHPGGKVELRINVPLLDGNTSTVSMFITGDQYVFNK